MLNEFLDSVFVLALEMAPYLLLGFFLAGVLHVWVPRKFYLPKISKTDFKSVLWAALFGIPLPICSCAVIPTSIALRREGASKGASVSFLIATPATGVDSILATYSLLGLPFAILRPLAALFTSVFGGVLTNLFTKNEKEEFEKNADQKNVVYKTVKEKIKETFRFGFLEMLPNLAKWLSIGILLGALIQVFVPDDFFISLREFPFLCMLLVLLISMPMYTCAFGSIPLALSLVDKGLTPGAALVLLMAGPATSFASMLVVGRAFGKKTLMAYLSSIAFGSLFFGFIIDTFFMDLFLNSMTLSSKSFNVVHSEKWWNIIALVFLVVCYVVPKLKKFIKPKENLNMAKCFIINGMNCNHCKMSVEKATLSVEGVKKAEVDLSSKSLYVEGEFNESELQQVITNAGFEFFGKK